MTIVPYFDLGSEAMRMIVELKLRKVADMLMMNNKMRLTYTPAVADQITARCTEVETGARNIEYIIGGNILPRLSQTILTHMTEGGMPAAVNLDVQDDGTFTFTFEE